MCKKIISFLLIITLFFQHEVFASEPDQSQLFSLSACLMDADTGCVLYGKDCDTHRANASTTKILTCILALEYGNLDDYVTVSKYAASMPDVQLGIQKEEQYRLGDLLYSLMLESHNDSAVAIAEHIAGDVKSFSSLMNEKAAQIGCTDTHFITPNGLDATEIIDGTNYIHGTTASDLCRIMSYCIKNEKFLAITQTTSYSFTNYVSGDDGNIIPGNKQFSVHNKNAFLTMMSGVLSGKTGFTADAGYCYVAALKDGERTYTIALLGCGWPNNKTYKWKDARLLFEYGLENYTKKDIFDYNKEFPKIKVKNGIYDNTLSKGICLNKEKYISLFVEKSSLVFLTKADDIIDIDYDFVTELTAPVEKNQSVGTVTYCINNRLVYRSNIYTDETVEQIDFSFCLKGVLKYFLLNFK